MREEIILHCEDSLEGMFTALYDAFVYKNRMKQPYRDTISIAVGEGNSRTLFAEEIEVRTDSWKAQRTVYAIRARLGGAVYRTLLQALCHYDAERATAALGYLVRGFSAGSRITEYLSDPYVMRVMELSRKCGRECDKFYGVLRFRDAGRFLTAVIEPKCNLLPLIAGHFEDRYPNENFIIYDALRRFSLVHPAYRESFFVKGEELARGDAPAEDMYEALWKQYFVTMGIADRKNENCQNNLLPKWYRKHMTEHF